MISLEMTDSDGKDLPSFWIASTLLMLNPTSEKWEKRETFSNPCTSAWPVGFLGIPSMQAQLPLPQCG